MIDHDPEFPYVFSFPGSKPRAKFRNKADADYFADEYPYGSVTDTTPKPLPTEPGIYVREGTDLTNAGRLSTAFYILGEEGTWLSDASYTWLAIGESEVPSDLVPLVKGTR